MRFKDFSSLTSELAFSLIEALKAEGATATFGMSNQSCSAYVNVSVEDDELDLYETIKVRFSDHADRHNSDVTIRIDDRIDTINDDCGDYVEIQVSDLTFADLLATAKEFVAARRAEIIAEATE